MTTKNQFLLTFAHTREPLEYRVFSRIFPESQHRLEQPEPFIPFEGKAAVTGRYAQHLQPAA
jgi:hypothetical protein